MDTINKIVQNGIEIEPGYKTKRGIILLRKYKNLLYLSGHGPEDQITGTPLLKEELETI